MRVEFRSWDISFWCILRWRRISKAVWTNVWSGVEAMNDLVILVFRGNLSDACEWEFYAKVRLNHWERSFVRIIVRKWNIVFAGSSNSSNPSISPHCRRSECACGSPLREGAERDWPPSWSISYPVCGKRGGGGWCDCGSYGGFIGNRLVTVYSENEHSNRLKRERALLSTLLFHIYPKMKDVEVLEYCEIFLV